MATTNLDPEKARLYDRRTVRRNIKKGLLTNKEYEAYLASLPDVADKIAPPEPLPSECPETNAVPAQTASRIEALPGTPVSPEAIAEATASVVAAMGTRREIFPGSGPDGGDTP